MSSSKPTVAAVPQPNPRQPQLEVPLKLPIHLVEIRWYRSGTVTVTRPINPRSGWNWNIVLMI